MRLQSHVWVSAFVRREQGDGAYAAVLRRGSRESGAIFVVQDHLNGNLSAWGPAPQSFFAGEDGADSGRRFEKIHEAVAESEVREWLERQVAFDPDCWIVETERRAGEPDLFD